MTARLPKSTRTVRAHVQMPRDWRTVIDKAARKLNMSRSNYIATAAIAAARGEMAFSVARK
jgi:uncharacterized protein (DUF1778 family)